jgi:hypothetical protein
MKSILVAIFIIFPIAASAETCKVRYTETAFNDIHTLISVQRTDLPGGGRNYTVIAAPVGTSSDMTVYASFENQSASIVTEAGVPAITMNELRRYEGPRQGWNDIVDVIVNDGMVRERGDGSILWEVLDGSQCDQVDVGLIMFLVDEWFFYG